MLISVAFVLPRGIGRNRSSTHTRHKSSRRVSIQARGGVVSEGVTTNNSAGCWRSLDTTVSLVLTHRGHRQSSSNACPCGKQLKLGTCHSPRVGASWQQSSTSTGAPSFQPQRFFPPFPSFTRLLQFPPSKKSRRPFTRKMLLYVSWPHAERSVSSVCAANLRNHARMAHFLPMFLHVFS